MATISESIVEKLRDIGLSMYMFTKFLAMMEIWKIHVMEFEGLFQKRGFIKRKLLHSKNL